MSCQMSGRCLVDLHRCRVDDSDSCGDEFFSPRWCPTFRSASLDRSQLVLKQKKPTTSKTVLSSIFDAKVMPRRCHEKPKKPEYNFINDWQVQMPYAVIQMPSSIWSSNLLVFRVQAREFTRKLSTSDGSWFVQGEIAAGFAPQMSPEVVGASRQCRKSEEFGVLVG